MNRTIEYLSAFLIIGIVSACNLIPETKAEESRIMNLIKATIDSNPHIQFCSLAVMNGTQSFSWKTDNTNTTEPFIISADSPYYIASITKMYTAVSVMMLIEKGELSLNDLISDYLPGETVQDLCVMNSVDYSTEITIEHLLSQSSGIADYYSDKTSDGSTAFDLFIEDPAKKWSVDDTIRFAKTKLTAQFAPGKGYKYSDTNYQLLGKIIESVTAKPLHSVYEELIFNPLQLKNTWLVNYPRTDNQQQVVPAAIYKKDMLITDVRKNGSYWADGGIISTAQDGLTFLMALNQGVLVKQETLQLMQNWNQIHYPMEYGFGLDRLNHPMMPVLWGHSGSTSSFLYYYEKDDLYISGTFNLTDANQTSFTFIKKLIGTIKYIIQKNSV